MNAVVGGLVGLVIAQVVVVTFRSQMVMIADWLVEKMF